MLKPPEARPRFFSRTVLHCDTRCALQESRPWYVGGSDGLQAVEIMMVRKNGLQPRLPQCLDRPQFNPSGPEPLDLTESQDRSFGGAKCRVQNSVKKPTGIHASTEKRKRVNPRAPNMKHMRPEIRRARKADTTDQARGTHRNRAHAGQRNGSAKSSSSMANSALHKGHWGDLDAIIRFGLSARRSVPSCKVSLRQKLY